MSIDMISAIIAEGERVERESDGRALLEHEVRAIKALAFLRKIAPYAFIENANDNGTLSPLDTSPAPSTETT